MSNVSKEISELLSSPAKAAPGITKPLKHIGDGNMLNGVKKIFDYAMTEGERKGFKKGSMYTLGTCGIIYVATKVAPLLKQRITKRKEHAAEGEKILSELKAELQEPVDCETEDVE